MARCGLEYAGHPGKDEFITNTGDKGQMDLTLHGKISNIPASEVMVTVDRQAPYTIRVRGRVDERVFFGPKLELWTEISTVPGSGKFTISDTLTNRGSGQPEAARAVASVLQDEAQADVSTLIRLALKKLSGA